VKQVFSQMDQIMKRPAAASPTSCSDVFIKESRYGDRFRRDAQGLLPERETIRGALITVTNFARPGIEIEIQSVGVIGDRCSSDHPCSAEGQAKKK